MNTTVQALERFRAEIGSHVSQIEVALALGATPNRTTISYVQATVGVSLILRMDSPRSLGIVWLPSLMAGMSS